MDTMTDVPVTTRPYPHFAADGVIDAGMLAEIDRHWPDISCLVEDSPGTRYYVLHVGSERTKLMTSAQQAYWMDFVRSFCLPLTERTFRKYSPWIYKAYGPSLDKVQLLTVMLTEFETDDSYLGIHCHPHPTWLFTNLIHISCPDTENYDGRGTIACGFERSLEPEGFDDEKIKWLCSGGRVGAAGIMQSQIEYPFKPGRMFSLLESRISYHGSQRPKRPVKTSGKRRAIRMHVATSVDHCQSLYGVSSEEYVGLYGGPREKPDPRAMEWLRTDIRNVLSANVEDTRLNVTFSLPFGIV